jgi:hypothetical protein
MPIDECIREARWIVGNYYARGSSEFARLEIAWPTVGPRYCQRHHQFSLSGDDSSVITRRTSPAESSRRSLD